LIVNYKKGKNNYHNLICGSLPAPYALPSPVMYHLICKESGLKKEYEKVLDILWRINKDVQHIMFSKLMKYDHSFNFGEDHWEDLIIHHVLRDVQNVELKEYLTKKYLKNDH
jgi:hypothetical protein